MKRKIKFQLTLILLEVLTSSLAGCGEVNSSSFQPSQIASASSESSFSLSTSIPVSNNNKYSNPVYPLVDGVKKPTYTADPYVVRDDDGIYYMYCTQTNVYTPEYKFVRGPIFSSLDLVNWTYKSNVFSNYTPTWGTSGAGVWAPTVAKIGDKWIYYYALSVGNDKNPGIGYASSDTPYGPWTHYGKLFNSEEIGVTNSIDPHVLTDNGKNYMAFGSFGGLITLIQLTDDGLGLKNGLDYQKENKISLGGYEVFDTNNYEASFILKANNAYYLLLSTGSCCSGVQSTYRVVAGKSDYISGPYLDSQGRNLFGPNRGDAVVTPSLNGAMGVGHCAVIQDDHDNYWMIYHGYDTKGTNPDYRSLYIDQLHFDETTGMPYIENHLASNETVMNGPYIKVKEE